MPAECSPLKEAWVRPRSPRRLVTPDLGWAVRPSHPFGGRQCAPTGVCKVAQKNSDASCAQVLEEGDEPPVPPAAAQRPALLREMAGSRLGARPSAWRPGGQVLHPHLSACSQSNTFRGKRSDFRLSLGVRPGWTSLSPAAFWAAGHPPCKLIFCPRGSPLRGLQQRQFAYWYAWVKFGKSCTFCVVWEDCKRFGTCHFGIWIILS